MATLTETPIAPGARVVIRDEEWIVRRVDPSSDNGYLLVCDGVSELVRGRTAHFLTALEEAIEVLDPAETELVLDTSSNFTAGLLHVEAMLRRNLPNDDRIRLGHKAVMDLVPYQLDPALQALRQPRQRILIADATGLGKTLEAGILATELIQRGRGSRILVVTLKSMLTQFQKEFWTRFSIPLVRLDSVGLAAVRNRIPANHNPFNYFDRSIISIDTLKTNQEYRNYLDTAWWDLIIIDECHNVAARKQDTSLSLRARLAQRLSRRSDALVLLSATPHDGSARSFASLMTLLDPTAISDPEDYTPEDYRDKGLVIRRFRKDIRHQVEQRFEDREPPKVYRATASPEEESAFEALLGVPFTQRGKRAVGREGELLRLSLQKALFSSPAAASLAIANRMAILEKQEQATEASRAEHVALGGLLTKVDAIDASSFTRYRRLLQLLGDEAYGWSPRRDDDRLVIFSERLETLKWLKSELASALKLREEVGPTSQIAILDGNVPDTDQMALVERFGRKADPLRVLLCSDVASEGLNLHHFCHRLVHFDLPWSLMVFQQRNGRIDRYGQSRKPVISYLLTETTVQRIRGDLRILEVLQQKDERANRDLGDPSAFMNLCDPDKEAELVEGVMADHIDATEFDAELERKAQTAAEDTGDWILDMFNAVPELTTTNATAAIAEAPSLFGDEYAFARAALEELGRAKAIAQWQHDEAARTLVITAPKDLQARLRQIPREARTPDDRYVLTVDCAAVKDAIERARQAKGDEPKWPDLEYLWPQHPISEWLRDRVLVQFGRHSAPILRSPHLAGDERAVLVLALIPNRKGQPMLVDWKAIVLRGAGAVVALEDFGTFVTRAGLEARALPNPATAIDLAGLSADLRLAVGHMQAYMRDRQATFAAEMETRLHDTLERLRSLQEKQIRHVQLKFAEMSGPDELRRGRQQRREDQIHRVFDDYTTWVKDSLATEPHPHLQVLAAVCR